MNVVVAEIKRRGTMDGDAVSQYCKSLGRKKKSAGGCLARALEFKLINIVGYSYINGRKVNVYA